MANAGCINLRQSHSNTITATHCAKTVSSRKLGLSLEPNMASRTKLSMLHWCPQTIYRNTYKRTKGEVNPPL
eukprot:6304181-Amphidinium_carterae.2